jgi:pimeloyl-ACP methyl ester carboxylesterase
LVKGAGDIRARDSVLRHAAYGRGRARLDTFGAVENTVRVGQYDFFVVDEGPSDGKPVLLLHGFPDSAQLWRMQVPALAEAGYRVIAPDLRGFGRSAKPQAVEEYALPLLVGDVVGLLDVLDVGRSAVVAHDWGAAVGWAMAAMLPGRVERLAALSVGHPTGYFSGGIDQLEKSWYMLWFLLPGVAEAGLTADNWSFLRQFARGAGDVDRWVAHCAADPGNLTAMLNWYRANIDPAAFAGGPALELPPVSCPVLGIWSDGDVYCNEKQMMDSERFVSGSWRYARIAGASHWIPVDAPDRLNALLLEFLES